MLRGHHVIKREIAAEGGRPVRPAGGSGAGGAGAGRSFPRAAAASIPTHHGLGFVEDYRSIIVRWGSGVPPSSTFPRAVRVGLQPSLDTQTLSWRPTTVAPYPWRESRGLPAKNRTRRTPRGVCASVRWPRICVIETFVRPHTKPPRWRPRSRDAGLISLQYRGKEVTRT